MMDPRDEWNRVDMPTRRSAKVFRRLRFWAIRCLAGRDTILLNAEMILPPGWELHKRGLDDGALICDNLLLTEQAVSVPHTLLLFRQNPDDE